MLSGFAFSNRLPLTLAVLGSVAAAAASAQTFTTIANFDATNNRVLYSLVQGLNGSFYGPAGGGPSNFGTIQAANGLLYGTTSAGGAAEGGTVFSTTLGCAFELVFSFDPPPAPVVPKAALVQGSYNGLYGTSVYGGPDNAGSLFRLTPSGLLTMLYAFDNTGGAAPDSALIQGADGNFYGMAPDGGAHNWGIVFQITPTGTFTLLHSFTGGADGGEPWQLVQGTDGDFYGTTEQGGSSAGGTAFRLSMGLGPFVRPVPAFGKTGASIAILGTNMSGPVNVTFNGTPATVLSQSPTALRVQVPVGATSGTVTVTTPDRTLQSNVKFQVL